MSEHDYLDDGLDDFEDLRKPPAGDDDFAYPFWGPPEPRLGDDMAPDLIELEKIPRRLWEQTLAPIRRQPRFYVAERIPDEKLRALAHELVEELEAAERDARQAGDAARRRGRQTAAPLPTPGITHSVGKRAVQINLRLPLDDHARLKEARPRSA